MKNTKRCVALLGATLITLGLACPPVAAADFEIVAVGQYASTSAEAVTYDGISTGALQPLLDLPRLEGGSFRATFRFPSTTPPPGVQTSYTPGSPYGMTTFQLLDPFGVVVYAGDNPFDAFIYVQNNDGSIPFSNDQVLLSSNIGAVTNLSLPTPLYSSPADFVAVADFNFAGPVAPGVNYTSDLSIPTDAGAYLSFPFHKFNVLLEFGDGDYVDRIAPYQYNSVQLEYEIRGLTVTPSVPEPATLSLVALGIVAILQGRRCLPRGTEGYRRSV